MFIVLLIAINGVSTGAVTVKDATDAYVTEREEKGRTNTAKDANGRFRRLVDTAPIGRILLNKLTSLQVRKWLNDQINKDEFADEDEVRRKDAFLTIDARTALLSACPDDLALLVRAALLTGSRTVAISTEAAKFFNARSKGKTPAAPLLATSFSQAWNKDNWKKPLKDAVMKAGLSDAVVLYSLRHTAISEMMRAGIDVFTVAKLTGTSVSSLVWKTHLCTVFCSNGAVRALKSHPKVAVLLSTHRQGYGLPAQQALALWHYST